MWTDLEIWKWKSHKFSKLDLIFVATSFYSANVSSYFAYFYSKFAKGSVLENMAQKLKFIRNKLDFAYLLSYEHIFIRCIRRSALFSILCRQFILKGTGILEQFFCIFFNVNICSEISYLSYLSSYFSFSIQCMPDLLLKLK